MGSFAGSCEIVEEKDEATLSKHSGRYGKSVSNVDDVEGRKQREYHGSLEHDIDKLFQSISVKPSSTRLITSSFFHSASAGPSSPSMRMSTTRTTTPQSPRVSGSLSLKQALRDRCVSKASEMAALKRLSKSAAASPRVSEADRIKSLYNQVSNNRSGFVAVDKGKGSLVETSLIPPVKDDKASTSRSVPQPLHRSNKGSCLSSGSGDNELELDENVASPSTQAFIEDVKHVTSLPSDNAKELEKKTLSPTLDLEQKGKLDNNTATSGSEKKSKTVTRTIPRPKQKPKKKILLKKKLKIGIVSVSNTTKKDEENGVSLDSTASKLLCQRCHCSLNSTSTDNKPSSYTSSHNPEVVAMKQDVSSSSDNIAKDEKETENPTSSEKFDFSLSSKDSLVGDDDYSRSTTTSMSEESRFSCGNKPHMSMDVRWAAIKHAKLQHGSLGLRHFNLLKKLGCGDIGTVYLAELIGTTNCLFAIKVMDSEFLAKRKKSPRAQAERDILKMLDHPFLPTLYAQFASDHLSCLVMEHCPGGDLHVLRQKQIGRCFPEPAARFYVAEILLALEYLHMLGVIYRDLKPENILVREDGHIMLTDFDLSLRCSVNPTLLRSTSPPLNDPARTSGPHNTSNCIQPFCIITEPSCQASCFSRQQGQKPKRADPQHLPQLVAEPTEARSNSFVGTHEYLAPEIIRGEGHGAAVDWWTFGVLLYELLYGKTPFKGYNNDETLANVVLQSLKFPDSPLVSFQAKDLIRGLLVKEPEDRLGSEKGSAEIKRHPFFEGLNWALIRCAVPPELPDFCEFGGRQGVAGSPGGNDDKYLECKAIGDHLEFELF